MKTIIAFTLLLLVCCNNKEAIGPVDYENKIDSLTAEQNILKGRIVSLQESNEELEIELDQERKKHSRIIYRTKYYTPDETRKTFADNVSN